MVNELLKDDFVHFKILCANEVHHFNKEDNSIIDFETTYNKDIINNIVEENVREELEKLINGEILEVNRIFTYDVNGDENNQKICEIFIERFDYGNKSHSIGFLTDITLSRKKTTRINQIQC
ncbi:MAG: hypothetical protein ACI389_04970 [Methanobrevibacter sp.]|uniref:hypothetical protein n=1 Tax=Methanobrevibacter sp. TaxID=66852 RepID=UPI003F03E021